MVRSAITIILIIGLVACLPLNPEHATNYATNYATNAATPLTTPLTPTATNATNSSAPLTRATNICVVTAWWLNVRQEPGIEHPAIGHYERGAVVTVLREARARDGGRWGYTGKGWINLRFVDCRPDVPLIEAGH